jgi:hypothetical protein
MRLTFPIIVAIGIAVVIGIPATLAVMSMVGVVMPWFMIGFIVWAAFAAGRGPRRQRSMRYQWGRNYWQSQPWPSSSRARYAAPAQPRPTVPELPIDVQMKAEQIKHKVDVLLSYASRFPPFSKDLYVVRQTATEYLPRTLNAYLALPPVDADRVLPSTGRTALDELKAQLDLLDSKLDEVADDLQRRDVDALLANRLFLEQRFGKAGNPAKSVQTANADPQLPTYKF